MKYRLIDLLACPICKTFPLQLIVFNKVHAGSSDTIKPCDEYCSYNEKKIADLKSEDIPLDCRGCLQINIVEGILICRSCLRWYPIIEEIPHMLPDDLRKEVEDLGFLTKNKERIPQTILTEGKPFNLSRSI
ncbi:MAG: hypothetical protein L6N94_07255 [Candidatus Methylarchaceae archaeon HK01M]|nr:hypothetical protein [Candidatus Methylarchaceae archaeon HK01M]